MSLRLKSWWPSTKFTLWTHPHCEERSFLEYFLLAHRSNSASSLTAINMAEEAVRSRQYEYKANSNLVLEADKGSRQIREDEGKGEVETLHGKLRGVRMGDKVSAKRSDDLDERIEASKRKRIAGNPDDDITSKKRKTSSRRTFCAAHLHLLARTILTLLSISPKQESRG